MRHPSAGALIMPGRVVAPEFTPGSVWLVGAGPGDPGLLTLHAAHALERADVILHDALIACEILALAGATARLEAVGKRAGRPSARQLKINQRLIDLARAGLRVVRLKGGDPFVFGRGGEEALALAAAGVPFRIVPGITSGIAGPAYAGIPATHRMRARSVAFVTGHSAGGGASGVDWPALAKGAETLVLYMALKRLPEIAAELLAAGRAPKEPVAILSEATTPRAEREITTLAQVAAGAASESRGATLIVIGPVVSLGEILLPWQQIQPAAVAGVTDDRFAAEL
jgi:uroporphyrin-III C-methyltransferase